MLRDSVIEAARERLFDLRNALGVIAHRLSEATPLVVYRLPFPIVAIRPEVRHALADPLGCEWARPLRGIDLRARLEQIDDRAAVIEVRGSAVCLALVTVRFEAGFFAARENQLRIELAASLECAVRRACPEEVCLRELERNVLRVAAKKVHVLREELLSQLHIVLPIRADRAIDLVALDDVAELLGAARIAIGVRPCGGRKAERSQHELHRIIAPHIARRVLVMREEPLPRRHVANEHPEDHFCAPLAQKLVVDLRALGIRVTENRQWRAGMTVENPFELGKSLFRLRRENGRIEGIVTARHVLAGDADELASNRVEAALLILGKRRGEHRERERRRMIGSDAAVIILHHVRNERPFRHQCRSIVR